MDNIEQSDDLIYENLVLSVRELISSISSILETNQNAPAELTRAKSKLIKVLCDVLMAKERKQNPNNYMRITNDISNFIEDKN